MIVEPSPAMTSRRGNPGAGDGGKAPTSPARRTLSKKHLEALVGEAIVDCYNESEQAMGLFTMIEDHLALPFLTQVLGVEVEVETVDLNDADEVVVICRREGVRQRLPVLDLPLPGPPPEGWEWIEAYRYWARGWR